jgi:hypothetical protein
LAARYAANPAVPAPMTATSTRSSLVTLESGFVIAELSMCVGGRRTVSGSRLHPF